MTGSETATATRDLRLDEPDGIWSVVAVPVSPTLAAIQAAMGVVWLAPECGGRTRTLERLEAGDGAAGLLAAEILRDVLATPGER